MWICGWAQLRDQLSRIEGIHLEKLTSNGAVSRLRRLPRVVTQMKDNTKIDTVPPSVLPPLETQELEQVLAVHAICWTSNHALSSSPTLLSSQVIRGIARHAPTTIKELKSLGLLDSDQLNEFGEGVVIRVQKFVEKYSLKEYLGSRFIEEDSSVECRLSSPKKVAPSLLSKAELLGLELLLKKLLSRRAAKSRDANCDVCVYDWDKIMSCGAIQSIAFHAPTTVDQLREIGSLSDPVIDQYGECIVREVQKFLTKLNANQVTIGQDSENSCENSISALPKPQRKKPKWDKISYKTKAHKPSSRAKAKSPKRMERELTVILQTLATGWAEEERITSAKSIYSWDILSDDAIKCIVCRTPTTMEHLCSIPSVKQATLEDYGKRIVAVVQLFTQRHGINGRDCNKEIGDKGDALDCRFGDEADCNNKPLQLLPGNENELARNVKVEEEEKQAIDMSNDSMFLPSSCSLVLPLSLEQEAKQLCSIDLLSNEAPEQVGAPTTPQDLKHISEVPQQTLAKYWVRVIAAIRLFLEKKGNGRLATTPKSSRIASYQTKVRNWAPVR